jgi:hypothetical protein
MSQFPSSPRKGPVPLYQDPGIRGQLSAPAPGRVAVSNEMGELRNLRMAMGAAAAAAGQLGRIGQQFERRKRRTAAAERYTEREKRRIQKELDKKATHAGLTAANRDMPVFENHIVSGQWDALFDTKKEVSGSVYEYLYSRFTDDDGNMMEGVPKAYTDKYMETMFKPITKAVLARQKLVINEAREEIRNENKDLAASVVFGRPEDMLGDLPREFKNYSEYRDSHLSDLEESYLENRDIGSKSGRKSDLYEMYKQAIGLAEKTGDPEAIDLIAGRIKGFKAELAVSMATAINKKQNIESANVSEQWEIGRGIVNLADESINDSFATITTDSNGNTVVDTGEGGIPDPTPYLNAIDQLGLSESEKADLRNQVKEKFRPAQVDWTEKTLLANLYGIERLVPKENELSRQTGVRFITEGLPEGKADEITAAITQSYEMADEWGIKKGEWETALVPFLKDELESLADKGDYQNAVVIASYLSASERQFATDKMAKVLKEHRANVVSAFMSVLNNPAKSEFWEPLVEEARERQTRHAENSDSPNALTPAQFTQIENRYKSVAPDVAAVKAVRELMGTPGDGK